MPAFHSGQQQHPPRPAAAPPAQPAAQPEAGMSALQVAAADVSRPPDARQQQPAVKGMSSRHLRLMLLCCLLLVSALAVQFLDATELELLVESLRGAPLASMVVFVLLFSVAVVLLVPGMLLSMGSGAAFGLGSGAVVAFFGTLLGQVGAFLLGRYLLRDLVVASLEKRVARFRAIDAGISGDGWKLVLLLRLSPVLPYNLMNYALGVTAIRLTPYIAASAVAAVPYAALFAYVGSVSNDIYRLLHDGASAFMTPQLLLGLVCIMILSAVGLFYVCRHAVIEAHPDELVVAGGEGGSSAEGRRLLPR